MLATNNIGLAVCDTGCGAGEEDSRLGVPVVGAAPGEGYGKAVGKAIGNKNVRQERGLRTRKIRCKSGTSCELVWAVQSQRWVWCEVESRESDLELMQSMMLVGSYQSPSTALAPGASANPTHSHDPRPAYPLVLLRDQHSLVSWNQLTVPKSVR
ncbi:hypothetical protein BCR34DRAFT_183922 [Clohesyomyces aquaticus]|uniref:Uncharacterized protein n=1 Tax=Clohesyomyces aquaticus TaxID=1231657 RepID=A0A1Y1ZYI3_9PLEO|nr:hypothetical protein BCR34DRAFT_183922 [Clohesyomyces aquaticus]